MTSAKTVGNQTRLRRYRACHERIDYTSSPDVFSIIEHHLKIGTDPCKAGVLDCLIRTAHRAITGNGGKCVGVTMVGRGRQTCCLPARFPALAAPKHWALGSYALDAMRSQEPAQRRHISAHCVTI